MPPPVLTSIGRSPGKFPPDAHVVLSVVRNEALRLPYLLHYYRSIGFDHFIFIDNDSTDGTREFLLDQPDTFVFHTVEHFGAPPGAGIVWKNGLLDMFCDGRWVLVVDADEILVWPSSGPEKIQALTHRMQAVGARALYTVMIDMYSEKPFGQIGYKPGLPFLDYSRYFDPGPFFHQPVKFFPFREVWGGVRTRLFESADPDIHPPTVSKVPLLRWHSGQRFILAQHALLEAMPLALVRGALLHYKMFDDLPAKCEAKTELAEYYAGGREYHILGAAIRKAPNGSFYDPAISVRYEGPEQLLALGLMKDSTEPAKNAISQASSSP